MEPMDTYLLAVGSEKSIDVVKNLNVEPRYVKYLQNEERKADRQYLQIEVNRDTNEVDLAVYLTHEEAMASMSPSFKVIVNH